MAAAIIFGYRITNNTPRGKSFLDGFKLHVPLFGDLLRKTAISRFSRTLGTLVTSGVPILQALDHNARKLPGTLSLPEPFRRCTTASRKVNRLSNHWKQAEFSAHGYQHDDVGEETGQLPEMLLKVADVYDDEVDNSVAGLTSMLEPIMIVFLALIVGTIVIALFMPLISIISGLQIRPDRES